MHRNVYTGVCLAAAMGVAAPAVAQTRGGASKSSKSKTVTAIGCLEAGAGANSFVLNVLDDGGAVPAGSRVSLTAGDHSAAQAHLGQTVQVLGTILGGLRSEGAPATHSRMYVRDIRQVAPQCAAGAQGVVGQPVRSTGTSSAIANASGAPAGLTSPLTAPASTTSAETASVLSGMLAQTGVSGNAALTRSPVSTTATSAGPVNGASPVLAPITAAASSLPSTSAQPANAPATTQTMAAPASVAPAVTADPPPVAVTGDPAVAQQMTNTNTMIGTLDQTGVSGDALLTGLVSVNVQQVMAAVQAQANVPVQADVIVNVSDIANDLQVQALVQALNTNPQASMNANDLTSALQSAGLIDPNQFVVGVTGSEIYSNTDLTTKLQQRGIISPSETIMSMLPGRIYVAGQ
jgi:hypothetical protein